MNLRNRISEGVAAFKIDKTKLAAFGVALLGIVLLVLHAHKLFFYTEEDAYIVADYTRNLATGNGLVFNVGEREWGCTTTLLPFLLTPLYWLGIAPVIGAKIIGLISVFVAGILTAKITSRHAPGWLAALVFLPIAGFGPLILWSVGGLGTALFIVLVVASLSSAFEESENPPRNIPLSVIWLLAATLARPDAPLYAPIIIWASWNGEWRRSVRWVVSFGVGFIAIWGALALYYGTLLPNTYLAKVNDMPDKIMNGTQYVLDFIKDSWLLLAATGAAGFLAFLWRGARRRDSLILVAAILLCAMYAWWVGGDWMVEHRFFTPIIFFVAPLLVWSAASFEQLLGARLKVPIQLSVAVVIGIISINLLTKTTEWLPRLRYLLMTNQQLLRLGTLVHGGDQALTYAMSDIGGFKWNSDMKVLDLAGLTEHAIAIEPHTINGPHATLALEKRRPDVILLRTLVGVDQPLSIQFFRAIVQLDTQLIDPINFREPLESTRWWQGDRDAAQYVLQNHDYSIVNIIVLPETGQFYVVLARKDVISKIPVALIHTRLNDGIAYYETGQKERGIELIQSQLAANPFDALGRLDQSVRLLSAHRNSDARVLLQEVLDMDPNDATAYNNIGYSFLLDGRFADAIPPLERALELDPGLKLAQTNLAAARAGRNIPSTAPGVSPQNHVADIEKAVAAEATPLNYLNLSLAYYQANRYNDCVNAARKAISLKPDLAGAYVNMCAAYNSLGQFDEGKKAGEEAVRLDPNNQLAKNNLAWSERELNKK